MGEAAIQKFLRCIFRNWIYKMDKSAQIHHGKHEFRIIQDSELAAGIRGFVDEVQISCESGDFGGDKQEFAEFMRDCLAEWYDGAKVEIIEKQS